MLPIDVVREIRRLLDAGELSQRQIALRTGVSRGTVYMLASGQHEVVGREGPAEMGLALQHHRLGVRCPGCGGLVYAPCMLCATRRRQEELRRRYGRRTGPNGRRVA